jgi:hypothetical protein
MSYVATQDAQDVIAAGGTETIGTIEGLGSTQDRLVGIFLADKAGDLTVEQSVDGTNWDYIDTIAVTANTGVKVSIEIYAPYARIRFKNTAGTDTTVTRGAFRTASAGAR